MNNHIIANPFFLYTLTWGFVFCIYELEWSDFYPNLSNELFGFFIVSFIISLIIALYCHKKHFFSYRKVPAKYIRIKTLIRYTRALYLLLFIEFIFTGCPLLSYITTGQTDYTEYGLPIIHVLVVCGFTAIALFSFHSFISTINKDIKKHLTYICLSCMFPFLLFFNRGGLLIILVGIALIYLMHVKKIGSKLCGVTIGGLIVLYMFGIMGDARTDLEPNQHLILDIGKATDDFRESAIPKEFFWSYAYIGTPIGNLQHNIDNSEPKEYGLSNLGKMLLFEFTPTIFSKRISEWIGVEQKKPLRLIPSLTVCSVYNGSFLYMGWYGLVFNYLFSVFFIFITIGFIRKESPYYVCLLTSVDLIIIFNLFDNMFVFMGLIPLPFIFLLFDRLKKITIKNKSNGS